MFLDYVSNNMPLTEVISNCCVLLDGLPAHRRLPTPVGYLVWPISFDFSRVAAPASSCDTAGTTLRTIRSTQALSPRQGEQPNGDAVYGRLWRLLTSNGQSTGELVLRRGGKKIIIEFSD